MKLSNKNTIFICERNPDNLSYTTPIEYLINLVSISGRFLLQETGEISKNILIGKVKMDHISDFKENSRCFVYKDVPVPYDDICNDADYYVKSANPGNMYAEIILEEMA